MDITTIKKDAEEKMQMTLEFLDETFARIRAGRANVRILDGVKVEYYGSLVSVIERINSNAPEPRQFDSAVGEKYVKVIEKAIMDSDVGITPENNGEVSASEFRTYRGETPAAGETDQAGGGRCQDQYP
jgi:ribosome recycling factor